jgi:hypothetical protein
MFELGLATAPTDERTLALAVHHTTAGLVSSGWPVVSHIRSPVAGARGAVEAFVHARRA